LNRPGEESGALGLEGVERAMRISSAMHWGAPRRRKGIGRLVGGGGRVRAKNIPPMRSIILCGKVDGSNKTM